jgi:hypothetical protein
MGKTATKTVEKKAVSGEIYREKFLKIIKKSKKPLYQAQIVDMFDNEYNKSSEDEPDFISRTTIQSAASRELRKLVESKQVLLIDNKYYQLLTRENERALVRNQIINEITFTDDSIFEITEKVWAIKVSASDLKKADELFSQYLKEYCFEVTIVRKMIIIMLECRKQCRDAVKSDLLNLLQDAVCK